MSKRSDIIGLLGSYHDAEIARRVGCSREYVRQTREAQGIEAVSAVGARHLARVADRESELRVSLLALVPVSQIARGLALTRQNIERYLREHPEVASARANLPRSPVWHRIAAADWSRCNLCVRAELLAVGIDIHGGNFANARQILKRYRPELPQAPGGCRPCREGCIKQAPFKRTGTAHEEP